MFRPDSYFGIIFAVPAMRIQLALSELWLCDGRGCAPADRISFENRPFEAIQHLRRLSSDVYAMRILRDACIERGILVTLRSNADVVRLMSNLLATGQVHFCRWDGGAFGKTSPLQGALAADEAEHPADGRDRITDESSRTTKTWVEFLVLDMEGNPASNHAYLLMLPDGSLHEGKLDKTGKIRFNGIDPGTCVFTLTELDQDAWQRVS